MTIKEDVIRLATVAFNLGLDWRGTTEASEKRRIEYKQEQEAIMRRLMQELAKEQGAQ